MAKLSILGTTLTTPEPYASGHCCTAAEAAVLNAALTRGIAKMLHRELTADLAADTSKAISEYLKGFSAGHERLRAIQAEARRIARGHIEAQLYRHGKKLEELAAGEREELVATEAARAEVFAEATRRIDTLRSIGHAGLEGLSDGM